MMQKLRERYASTNMTSRMSLLFLLMTLRYKEGDMGEYIDQFSSILDQLEGMNGKVPEDLAVIMFVFSSEGMFESTVAAVRQSDRKLQWDDMTNAMIEEYKRIAPVRSMKFRHMQLMTYQLVRFVTNRTILRIAGGILAIQGTS